MKKTLLALTTLLLILCCAAAACAANEEFPRIIVYGVLKPVGENGKHGLYCIDKDGDLWGIQEAETENEQDIVQLLLQRRGMEKMRTLLGDIYNNVKMDKEQFRSLTVMADVVPRTEGGPAVTGAGTGELAVYALRFDHRSDQPETVLLGICGSTVFENKDPNAQELFLFMWRQLYRASGSPGMPCMPCGFAEDGLAPHGFEMISVRDFFHLQDADAEKAVISAALMDCEEGPIEVKMSEADRKEILELLDRGVITGLDNPWVVSGGTTVFSFRDAEGNYLGSIELYEGLAVGKEGMYRMSLLPVSTEKLTPEEQKLLHFTLNGVEYELGKSTPRDLIRNGWICSIEPNGTFTFMDRERTGSQTDDEEPELIYVSTKGGGIDEPIKDINLQYVPDVRIEYYGFDGKIDPEDPEDPDAVWYKKMEEEYSDLDEDDEDGDEEEGEGDKGEETESFWSGFEFWASTLGKVDDTVGSGTDVTITLSDGRRLGIFAASFPANLHLSESADKW